MSQEKFSEKCGLSTDNYRKLEYNKHSPKSNTVDKIGSAFNLTPIDLLRYGIEQHNDSQQLLDLVSGPSETQIKMVDDFIGIIRKYN